MKWRKISQMFHYYPIQNSLINSLANFAFMCHGHFFARNWLNLKIVTQNLKTHYPRTLFKFVRHPVETREEWVGRLSSWCEINFLWYCCTLTRWETPKECAVVVRNLVFPPFRNIITIVIEITSRKPINIVNWWFRKVSVIISLSILWNFERIQQGQPLGIDTK